ncbi:hypothetical protein [Nitrosospira sp. NpAV]|uniref:hypothetical protein n=1 Tax=Nitrosospira sp. NpAV TaxID=58133 RepID=UPI0005A1449F|nr:hypothetical protein [Nitrosospira sp. NpAV]KIO49983.1 hypothetical protein SQ11_03545 [Nitrosospira sp. NpAV]
MAIQQSKNPPRPQTKGGVKKKEKVMRQKPLSPIQEKEELLLPHDRDETTGSSSTASATMHQESRDTVKQAVADIERGVRDTERRGIPSDVPPGTSKK